MAGKVTQKSHCRDKKISVELAHRLFYSDIGVTLSFLCGVITMNLFTGRQARPQASINSLKWLWISCQILLLSNLALLISCAPIPPKKSSFSSLNTESKTAPNTTPKKIEPYWIIDQKGCKHWNSGPLPDETVTWTGDCKNGYASGQGELQWYTAGKKGEQYIGNMANGKCHGQGKLVFADGGVYEGQWQDSKYHGQGKQVFANGKVYEGEFKDDKLHGQGKAVYANPKGNETKVYEGQWQDGKYHGQGKAVFANGDMYEGEFKDDKCHGQGKYLYKNAKGDSIKIYEGQWQDGKHHGQGKAVFANGDVYEGQWENDHRLGDTKFEAKEKRRQAKEQAEKERLQAKEQAKIYERNKDCRQLYINKLVRMRGGVSGLIFGFKQVYFVEGFSTSTGKATIRSEGGEWRGEVPCYAIPD